MSPQPERQWGRGGAASMEFALVMLCLAPLVLLTIEMSWYLAVRVNVEHCVRDGVRAGSDRCDPTNRNWQDGGEGQGCATTGDPVVVAEQRFEDCWADSGYTANASTSATGAGALENGADGDRKLRLTGSVAYTPLAGWGDWVAMPNPVVSEAVYRLDDQSF